MTDLKRLERISRNLLLGGVATMLIGLFYPFDFANEREAEGSALVKLICALGGMMVGVGGTSKFIVEPWLKRSKHEQG